MPGLNKADVCGSGTHSRHSRGGDTSGKQCRRRSACKAAQGAQKAMRGHTRPEAVSLPAGKGPIRPSSAPPPLPFSECLRLSTLNTEQDVRPGESEAHLRTLTDTHTPPTQATYALHSRSTPAPPTSSRPAPPWQRCLPLRPAAPAVRWYPARAWAGAGDRARVQANDRRRRSLRSSRCIRLRAGPCKTCTWL